MDETERITLQADIVFAVIFALVALAGTIFWYRKRRKRRESLKWPISAAKIAGYSIREKTRGDPPQPYFLLHVSFTYAANDESYPGKYEEKFSTAEQAKHRCENYCSLPFYIRYNPDNASDYFVDPYRDVWFSIG